MTAGIGGGGAIEISVRNHRELDARGISDASGSGGLGALGNDAGGGGGGSGGYIRFEFDPATFGEGSSIAANGGGGGGGARGRTDSQAGVGENGRLDSTAAVGGIGGMFGAGTERDLESEGGSGGALNVREGQIPTGNPDGGGGGGGGSVGYILFNKAPTPSSRGLVSPAPGVGQ